MASEAAAVMSEQKLPGEILLLASELQPSNVLLKHTYRPYDALQYPILFPRGEERYHIELYQVNPTAGVVSS
ncbi:hypothetical protein TNCV_2869351 [Trichonephila clavipes]|nr:hypothetical protein TNCV_2869351 [Trichonephila clavipes]